MSTDDPMQERPGLGSNFAFLLLIIIAVGLVGLGLWALPGEDDPMWPVAGATSSPAPSPSVSPDPQEDEPGWDCETMGDHSGCVLPGWDCSKQGDGVCQFADLDAPGFWGRVLDIRDDYARCLITVDAAELPAVICEALPHPSPSKAPGIPRTTFRGF